LRKKETVTGTVSDKTGMPLPGVSVLKLKGTKSGTQLILMVNLLLKQRLAKL
jgi:hypothetical protein